MTRRLPPMRPLARAVALALGLLGAGQIALAAVDPVKAWLGQRLLERAWERGQGAGRVPSAPWGMADLRPAARLSLPRLGVSAVVLADASGAAMAWGPGHVAGTAPLGGPGLAAVAGHRDSHLAFLARARPGDRVLLELADGRRRAYRIREGLVVDSRHWRFPKAAPGAEVLALATCWPLGAAEPGPLRLVLLAEAAPQSGAPRPTGRRARSRAGG